MKIEWDKVDRSRLLEDVLSRLGVQLRPRSGWQPVRCPNGNGHARGDRRPSASANVALGKFACMGCGMRGDGFDLARDLLGLDARQVLDGMGQSVVISESEFLF
jgi:hypothetical protein